MRPNLSGGRGAEHDASRDVDSAWGGRPGGDAAPRPAVVPEVDSWVEEHKDRIELFYLPRRSPERNPDEYLNNDVKGSVNEAGLPDSQDDLRSRMVDFMCKLFHWPGRVMDYFLHPCVLYACGP